MGSVRRPLLPVAAALVVLAGACTPEVDDRPPDEVVTAPATPAPPSAPPSPLPSPTPDLTPVAGERVPGAHWVDSSGLLTPAAPAIGPPDTVLPFVHEVGDWLDAHLDDLQRGGPGRLDEVAVDGLLAAAGADELAAVTTALASPDTPVAAAVYRLDASYAASTEWLAATVEVVSDTGATSAATLVFVPGGDGPALVLFGPATTAQVPS